MSKKKKKEPSEEVKQMHAAIESAMKSCSGEDWKKPSDEYLQAAERQLDGIIRRVRGLSSLLYRTGDEERTIGSEETAGIGLMLADMVNQLFEVQGVIFDGQDPRQAFLKS